MSDKERLDAI
jgi:hypothetical protein